MFTGIVTDIGTIAKITQTGDTRFDVLTAYDTETIDLGASISHSGVCLTVIVTINSRRVAIPALPIALIFGIITIALSYNFLEKYIDAMLLEHSYYI